MAYQLKFTQPQRSADDVFASPTPPGIAARGRESSRSHGEIICKSVATFLHLFRTDFHSVQPASFASTSFICGTDKLVTFRCTPNTHPMNGVTQPQTQRSKMPGGPAPVNVSPAPPLTQKSTPSNQHPNHSHPRSSQQQTTQLPPNPATNGQNLKNKKKGDPAPVDPAVMYESLKNRIAALEEEETHEEEEERRFGASSAASTLI